MLNFDRKKGHNLAAVAELTAAINSADLSHNVTAVSVHFDNKPREDERPTQPCISTVAGSAVRSFSEVREISITTNLISVEIGNVSELTIVVSGVGVDKRRDQANFFCRHMMKHTMKDPELN